MSRAKHNRILAIDLASRGFGFAVLEDSQILVDWGFREVRRNKTADTLRKVGALLNSYGPSVIVLQDYFQPGSRRNGRVQQLSLSIGELAQERGIKMRWIRLKQLVKGFGASKTKHEIATEIAKMFPELQRHLPMPRRIYDAENPKINIFDAMALATQFSLR